MMTVTLENRGLNLSNVLCSKTTHNEVRMAMGPWFFIYDIA